MDIQTIDSQYAQLQGQAQQTIQELKDLAVKLQTAAGAGDTNAKEWLLDLKSIAIAIQSEQNQVTNLLQAIHNFADSHAQAPQQLPQSVPGYPPPPQMPYGQQGYPPGGYPPGGYPPPARLSARRLPEPGRLPAAAGRLFRRADEFRLRPRHRHRRRLRHRR